MIGEDRILANSSRNIEPIWSTIENRKRNCGRLDGDNVRGNQVVEVILLDIRKQHNQRADARDAVLADRELLVSAFVVGIRQANLLHIVLAAHACSSFTHLLHRRQEQSHQDRDNRDHDQ